MRRIMGKLLCILKEKKSVRKAALFAAIVLAAAYFTGQGINASNISDNPGVVGVGGYYIDRNTNKVYIKNADGSFSSISDNGPLEYQIENSATSHFIRLADNWTIPEAVHGQQCFVVLPLINYGNVELKNIVVTPVTDGATSKWPFKLENTGGSQVVASMPPFHYDKDILELRQEVGWNFTVRDDVYNGYYPVKFSLLYQLEGKEVSDTITTYVHAKGAPGAKTLDGEDSAENKAKPRIIVTGFTTDPAEVYAGDIFNLDVTVLNTSNSNAVTNVLFNLKAAVESTSTGSTTGHTYEAFLPTSGSSSLYFQSIAPGETRHLNIEMMSRADLTQKPYVLDVDMTYDSGDQYNLTDKASVSIPVKQPSRMELSNVEVIPESIDVGAQSNVMFSVYNTGRTVLYNTWVRFSGDSISGGDTYVGNINSGATGSVDAMVTGEMATMDDGIIKILITYEDEAGNVTEQESEFTLFVNEPFIDDFGTDPGMDMPPEGGGGASGLALPVGIGVVVIAAAAFVIIKKRNKKSKTEEESTEDII